MIAVDTSVLAAIVFKEAEAEVFAAMLRASEAKIGAPTLMEARMVIEGRSGPAGLRVLEEIVALASVSIVPFAERHAAAAYEAHRRFGKGRGHRAKLNICDCFSYATAFCDDLPLLFKGEDFTHTDIRPAYQP